MRYLVMIKPRYPTFNSVLYQTIASCQSSDSFASTLGARALLVSLPVRFAIRRRLDRSSSASCARGQPSNGCSFLPLPEAVQEQRLTATTTRKALERANLVREEHYLVCNKFGGVEIANYWCISQTISNLRCEMRVCRGSE